MGPPVKVRAPLRIGATATERLFDFYVEYAKAFALGGLLVMAALGVWLKTRTAAAYRAR